MNVYVYYELVDDHNPLIMDDFKTLGCLMMNEDDYLIMDDCDPSIMDI